MSNTKTFFVIILLLLNLCKCNVFFQSTAKYPSSDTFSIEIYTEANAIIRCAAWLDYGILDENACMYMYI